RDAVAGVTRRRIELTGPGPDNDQAPQYVLSANQELARTVLVRTLNMMAPDTGQLTWLLYYDVGSGAYYLNFAKAPVAVTQPRTNAVQPLPTVPAHTPTNAADVPPH